MMYNILNGDSLAYSFPDAKSKETLFVIREALIEGTLSGNDLQELWYSRAKYMGLTEVEYHNKVASEFEKIMNALTVLNSVSGLSMTYSAR